MAKKKMYLLRDLYEVFLRNKLSKKSQNDYLTKTFLDDEDVPNQVASFLNNDEPIYAYTILDDLYKGNKGDNKSWWKKYYEFIRRASRSDVKASIAKSTTCSPVPSTQLDDLRKQISKNSQLHIFDGMQALVDELGEDRIIELALLHSYFFSPTIVAKRHEKIVDYIQNGNVSVYDDEFATAGPYLKNRKQTNEGLPARKTENGNGNNAGTHINGKYIDEFNQAICDVIEDGNNNSKVCSIINKYTGYNLNQNLDKKPFKNYIISHVWGRAIDPRYFTNLWNVVLIPAWANHLMDKDDFAGTLSAKLKAVIMKICIQLYAGQCNGWSAISMSSFPQVPSDKNVVKIDTGLTPKTYTINVIEEKNGNKLGKMSVRQVTV